jgi:tellurite resistance protein
MVDISQERLEDLRELLRSRGQRPSLVISTGAQNLPLAEAMEIVEEFGSICEAMFLLMAADRRVTNAGRELLRGALDVVSNGRVRTIHMDAMLDASARRVAKDGIETRLTKVVRSLADDPARAEVTLVLGAALAAADGDVSPARRTILERMAKDLEIEPDRAEAILGSLVRK